MNNCEFCGNKLNESDVLLMMHTDWTIACNKCKKTKRHKFETEICQFFYDEIYKIHLNMPSDAF